MAVLEWTIVFRPELPAEMLPENVSRPMPVVLRMLFSKIAAVSPMSAETMSDRRAVDAVPLIELFFVMVVVPLVESNTSDPPPVPEAMVTG